MKRQLENILNGAKKSITSLALGATLFTGASENYKSNAQETPMENISKQSDEIRPYDVRLFHRIFDSEGNETRILKSGQEYNWQIWLDKPLDNGYLTHKVNWKSTINPDNLILDNGVDELGFDEEGFRTKNYPYFDFFGDKKMSRNVNDIWFNEGGRQLADWKNDGIASGTGMISSVNFKVAPVESHTIVDFDIDNDHTLTSVRGGEERLRDRRHRTLVTPKNYNSPSLIYDWQSPESTQAIDSYEVNRFGKLVSKDSPAFSDPVVHAGNLDPNKEYNIQVSYTDPKKGYETLYTTQLGEREASVSLPNSGEHPYKFFRVMERLDTEPSNPVQNPEKPSN